MAALACVIQVVTPNGQVVDLPMDTATAIANGIDGLATAEAYVDDQFNLCKLISYQVLTA